MISSHQRDVVIIGASLAGLFAAAAAATAGARTMIIERDVLPDQPVPRKGVPQGRQPHVCCIAGCWLPKNSCLGSAGIC
jgi:cation diffusion facilitator CzcD-associated flavoprotein CzcO